METTHSKVLEKCFKHLICLEMEMEHQESLADKDIPHRPK
jgi:hypothetical protein